MDFTRVTSEDFKKAIEGKKSLEGLLPVKGGPALVERTLSDDDERILTFTISTGDEDRDRDTVSPDGWELDNFIKGGSVLWAHDPSIPAPAKPLATWIENGKLRSRPQFTPKEMYPFGFMLYEMFRDGYMRGSSVGFLPKEWKENGDRGGWMPLDFLRQELLEWSLTPVPANPNALIDAKSKGIDLAPMVEWASKFLDCKTESGLCVSREIAESMYRQAKGSAPIVVQIQPNEAILSAKQTEELESKGEVVDPPSGDYKWYAWDKTEAKKWLKDNDYKTPEAEEIANYYAFRQENPDDFSEFKTKNIGQKKKPTDFDPEKPEGRPVLLVLGDKKTWITQSVKFWHGKEEREDNAIKPSAIKQVATQLDKACGAIAKRGAELAEDLKLLLEMFGKSGRVLSAANEAKLREARDLLSQVLAHVDEQDSDDDDKNIDLDLDITEQQKSDEGFELDADSLRDALGAIVRDTVDSAIRRARGLVD